MITALVTLGIIFWLFYYLFIKGNAWPILFFIFGVYGGTKLISQYFPSSLHTVLVIMPGSALQHNISYATFIAALISILAIGILMEKASE